MYTLIVCFADDIIKAKKSNRAHKTIKLTPKGKIMSD